MQDLHPLFNLEYSQVSPLVIAGPCSAESRGQTLSAARSLSALGVPVFRAGVWKPRTKPGGFEGYGAEALGWLCAAKEKTGMKVITEVATASHLRLAVDAGLDGVWIGARTAANPFAVQEIADALASLSEEERDRITVMVKNPVNPDLELWIGALERIYGSGARRLGAIHRGFSSYGANIYRNPPRWAIPIELGRRLPGLPILFDPSHVAGRRELVETLMAEASGMHFSGYIVEVHPNPREALSDAAQQLTPGQLGEILARLSARTGSSPSESLESLRLEIDAIDSQLLALLARRMEISREIGDLKRSRQLPVVQFERYKALMEKRVAEGCQLALSPEFVRTILATIHEESVRQQL